ncbi:hypothetical protein [Absidia glauca]|uniref:Ndc10 domain-containing protein n=1 Tax=Absidia glauca TaxID=4829 RepID=A0A168NQD8_ABSGL|nr:hypothetical protein [Absidia glauca]
MSLCRASGVSSSHRESIGKALSSAGIRSNKKTHINRGSSARVADIVCANEDQIRRQGRGSNTTMKGISHQPSKRNDAINGRLPHQWGRSSLLSFKS